MTFSTLQVLNGHLTIAHLTRHAHAFVDTGWRGSRTNGTRSAHAVVLTVRRLTHTGETVAAHHTLESAALARAHNGDELAFGKNVTELDFIAQAHSPDRSRQILQGAAWRSLQLS